jgi:hypothetical protein
MLSSVGDHSKTSNQNDSLTNDVYADIFKQIVGPKDLRHGNSLLADIVVVEDHPKGGEVACTTSKTTSTNAALCDYDTEKPLLVVVRGHSRWALSAVRLIQAPE